MKRRIFVKQAAILGTGWGLAGQNLTKSIIRPDKNKLPRWKGFNLTDFFSPDPVKFKHQTTEDHLKWMRDWGFDFVRLPIAYPCYLDFDRSRDIQPQEVYQISERAADFIEELILMVHKENIHVSLNLHRAPGYCINAGFHEPFDLWKDESAQNAFYFHWNYWAKRFSQVSEKLISFDLVNEPSMKEDLNDQHSRSGPVPGDIYRKVAAGASSAIRKENPNHLIIADGNSVGNHPIPELINLDIGQSCRGYFPGAISHYKAPWANKDPDHMPVPMWPGQVGDQFFSRRMLEEYYQPWIDLKNQGVGVHCGECGCWNKTPHQVFLTWFRDVLDILSSNQIGFCLRNFTGGFGILDSGRTDVEYEQWNGHQLDRKLLDLMRRYA